MTERLWTTRQLAEEAQRRGRRVTQQRLRQLCADGKLIAKKPGRDWLIPDREARRFLEEWLAQG